MKTTTSSAANRLRMRRILPATLIATSAALGGMALGYPAIASAAPEWDIGKYDDCIAEGDGSAGADRLCCEYSGGVWIPRKPGTPGKCTAPAPEVHTPVQPQDPVLPEEQTQVPDQPQGPVVPRRGQVGTLPTNANSVP